MTDPAPTPYRSAALGGSDIGRCLTRLHHDRFTPAVRVVDDVRQRAFAEGIAFENSTLSFVRDLGLGVVSVRPGPDAEADTLAAMAAGHPLITGGRLTSDDGRLVGYPDLLVRLPTGFAAVDVKHHKVLGESGPEARWTRLDRLADPDGEERRFRGFRRRDLLQVAHYWHLLERAGWSTDTPIGGIIGTDEPAGCAWVDLTAGEAPVMEDYLAYLEEALRAIDHGLAGDEAPLHRAWLRGECRRCDWEPRCTAELEAIDDPTLLRDVDADLRRELAADDITTIGDIAAMDPGDDRLPDGATVLRARARSRRSLLRPDPGGTPLPLPTAPVEVDFDIETYGGMTYLAGLLITDEAGSRYEPVVDWRGTPDGERAVFEDLFARFASWGDEDLVVYHWTDYERRVLTEAAERHGLTIGGHDSIGSWFDARAVDLWAWTREHLVSPNGFSLKTIAPLCGFDWRDDDPGGLQSEIWFERLHDGEPSMERRLLAYNEDDVRAQLAVRRWIRTHDSGAGPGSGIPSALEWPAT